jgi:hypothetical protein
VNLRQQAEADLAVTLTDPAAFGWPVTVKNPAGTTRQVYGQFGDIGMTLQPDTGQAVSGRKVYIALRIADLAGLGMPRAEGNPGARPWTISAANISGGGSILGRVVEAMPDRALGLIMLILERITEQTLPEGILLGTPEGELIGYPPEIIVGAPA